MAIDNLPIDKSKHKTDNENAIINSEAMSWFEEWFDSPYYHLLYANRSEAEAENFITAIVATLEIPRGAKIIDVACGKGRHSRTLAQLGFYVTGIDLSKNNIDFARQFENAHLKFAVCDMREVYQQESFDFVFNLFSSFGYFESNVEDEKVINAFAGNLKDRGTSVLIICIYIYIGATLEERKLEELFGEEYREYKKRVKMLIPFLF